jgi:hypothetical protein
VADLAVARRADKAGSAEGVRFQGQLVWSLLPVRADAWFVLEIGCRLQGRF